jgi:hypothetical protein
MLADEYILSFISLSAHIQPTEFYQLLLLSSSSVFQSAAAPGWTLKNTSTAASSGRWTEMAASPVVLLRKPLLWLATKTRPA